MTEEQAFALANPDGGVYVPGAFVLALGTLKAEPRIAEAFRTGAGMGWHEHDEGVFTGCEMFFRPGYIANLVPSWIPVQPPPQYVLALAWRRGEQAAAAHRFLAYLRDYRDRHAWITGPQLAPPAHDRDPGLTASAS
jgi:hypothetical protein